MYFYCSVKNTNALYNFLYLYIINATWSFYCVLCLCMDIKHRPTPKARERAHARAHTHTLTLTHTFITCFNFSTFVIFLDVNVSLQFHYINTTLLCYMFYRGRLFLNEEGLVHHASCPKSFEVLPPKF